MRILFCEPFAGGSHARFAEALTKNVDADWTVLSMPARHWKWRMRGSALWMAEQPEVRRSYDVLLATSYVPLAELIGLAPELRATPSILYFHENQLAYPVRDAFTGERDNHFGFTQIVSAAAATTVVFNSEWNRRSFLDEAARLLARMPDAVPKRALADIEHESRVLGVPLLLPDVPIETGSAPPVILWNHRWEHDKDPDAFFGALFTLADRGVDFRLIVCGERYGDAPEIFERAERVLAPRILHFGTADRETYHALLLKADLAVSTAAHEFFGLSVLEAVHFGARPVVPDRLSYVELFEEEYRYTDLTTTLAQLLSHHDHRADRRQLTRPFGAALLERYRALLTSMRPG